ncbi:alternative sulfate transporter [Fusarium tjaetaba]|uniref:Alternative sulfate transporter n=1 Tax=Fusarium tjaetaba TaxID=1567544 RepID=A0A8H5VIU2_9HYPO|nr:alternative sulfate transporter [Fusarium tjaetaba]KAF5622579.1 alternative sulfate transporter [Fusarium tjaetaba]
MVTSDKQLEGVLPSPVVEDRSSLGEFTSDDEKKLCRKVDFFVLPLLILGFIALNLDRSNIAYALTDSFFEDVGITQNQFNIGQQLLAAGIIILEIPSNMVLMRFGPGIWFTAQITAWGLVATFQAWQKGLGSYLALRVLLGICESGYIPGALYCISIWYKHTETSSRFAMFFLGNSFSSAIGGLIAYGVLRMRGVGGMTGWQWLFILEGIFTVLIGVAFAIFFPKSTRNPVSLFGISFFTEKEAEVLRIRESFHDQHEGTIKGVSLREVWAVFCNWRVYPHLLIVLLGLAPGAALNSYTPSLISSYGYSRLQSNALTSVSSWIQLIVNPVAGFIADYTRRRGLVVLGGFSLWWLFALVSRLVNNAESSSLRFGILTMALSFTSIWHPVNSSWIVLNCRSPNERNISMALYIMAANCAGLIGPQLFRSADRPYYVVGWTVIISLLSFSLLCCILANIIYRALNNRLDKKSSSRLDGVAVDAGGHDGKETTAFRYAL